MANHAVKKITITIPVPSFEHRFGANWLAANWSYFWIAFLMAPSLIWICKDHSVWPWDQSWYGQVSTDLWFWLGHSLQQWIANMADGLNMKPPGTSWLGQLFVPLGVVFGSVEAGLLFSILLTQSVMLFLLFRIGQAMGQGSRLIPAAGVLFAAASQLFVGLSHHMLVEPLQAVATVWTFYIALRAPEWPKSRIVVHLGAALVLGLLAKATSPLYCLVPCLYCCYFLVRKPGVPDFQAEWKLWPSRILAIVFACLAVACTLWYFRHIADVWQHVRDASSGDVALAYGSRDSIPHKLVLWSGLLAQSFFGPYLLWGCLAAIVVGAVVYPSFRSASRGGHRPRLHPLAFLGAVQIALMLVVFSMNITVEPRFMYALLPCTGIVFMQICAFLPRKALAALIVLACAQWAAVNAVSLGLRGPFPDQAQWLLPLHTDRSQYDELARIVRLTDAPGHYNIVTIEEPWLNANSASFFAAKRSLQTGQRGYYTGLAYAEKDIRAAIHRIEEFRPRYLITLAEPYQAGTPNFINLVSLPVLAQMRRDPRFTQTNFESRLGVVMFQFTPDAAAVQDASHMSQEITQPAPVDSQGAPLAVSRGGVQKRGKSSLGWLNGKLPMQDHRGRTFMVNGSALTSCLGWAFDDLNNSTPEEVWLEFIHSVTGQHYYWRAIRYSRPELADALKLPSIRMAGIKCQEPGVRLPPGTYTTKVYQATAGGTIASDLDTWEPSPVVVVQ